MVIIFVVECETKAKQKMKNNVKYRELSDMLFMKQLYLTNLEFSGFR